MKRFYRFLVMACLMLWAWSGNAFAYTLSLTDGTGVQGGTSESTITLGATDGEALVSLDIVIGFDDTKLEYVSTVPNSIFFYFDSSLGWNVRTLDSYVDTSDLKIHIGILGVEPFVGSSNNNYNLGSIKFNNLLSGMTLLHVTSVQALSDSATWSDADGNETYFLDLNQQDSDLQATITISQPNPVPEPSTLLLFGAGMAGLAAVGRRRGVVMS